MEVLRSRAPVARAAGPPRSRSAFAAAVGAPHASAVLGGHAGLHLALRAVGVSRGDEVVTSPFSFVATANDGRYERARPVSADIDPVTLNLDPSGGGRGVTERTTAILPVHIFGYPADLPAFECAGPAARRGRLRGPGRRPRRRRPRRRARPSVGLRLLRQQADHHR